VKRRQTAGEHPVYVKAAGRCSGAPAAGTPTGVPARPPSRWRLLRHPTERNEGPGRFESAAEVASNLASSSVFFSLCILVIAVWVVGMILGLSDSIESDITGSMTAMTLLLVAVLKNSERRAERAMQLKLDAIAAALLEDRENGPGPEAKADLEEAVRLHEEI
jgi:low affinity Fe/Cu permease